MQTDVVDDEAISDLCATWSLAVIAILLSPIFLIFAAVGMGLDIFDLAGEGPVALALSAPVIFVLLRRGRRHAAGAA